MYPELFEIPFIHLTLKSYGLMMVVAFLVAVFLIRRLARDITPNPQFITNAALYSLIAGVVGARLFYVVHYFDKFRGNLLSIFAIWQGGLELVGGIFLALAVIVLYLRYYKLPIRRYLDILAIGLMAALAFGRIGCFLNGCCFGKPTNLPWAVRFPYGSFAYQSQVAANPQRNRPYPQLELPEDFFVGPSKTLKPYKDLTEDQKQMLKKDDKYRSLPVHPTQLYSSANAALLGLILYLFWRRSQNTDKSFIRPGWIFSLMFILYGITRFFIEFLRDDNPIGFASLTISQNIGIALIVLGVVLAIVFRKIKPDESK